MPIIDIDVARSVAGGSLQNRAFFFEGALELAAESCTAACGNYRKRQPVPANMICLLGILQIIETDFNQIRSVDVWSKHVVDGFRSKSDAQATGAHFKKTAPSKDSARPYPAVWRARACRGRGPETP